MRERRWRGKSGPRAAAGPAVLCLRPWGVATPSCAGKAGVTPGLKARDPTRGEEAFRSCPVCAAVVVVVWGGGLLVLFAQGPQPGVTLLPGQQQIPTSRPVQLASSTAVSMGQQTVVHSS